MPEKFVHLHTHSHYSLLDGLAKIDDLVNEAVQNAMPALALTDHGNMHGAIEFYKKAQKAGIKPVLGVEMYVAPRSLSQKEASIDTKPYHLLLLAKNEEGYKNLLKLVSISHLEGFYYKPRIDKDTLSKHSKGIIGASACLAGELPRLMLSENYGKAKEAAAGYADIFGKDSFFIEISHHPGVPNHNLAMSRLVELSKQTGIPLVATQDIHYLKKEDALAQDALVAIQTNTTLGDKDRLSMSNDDYSFRSTREMLDLFRDLPEATKNTVEIAEMTDTKLKLGEWIFPKFEIPSGKTADEHLRGKALEGLKKKFPDGAGDEITKRMDYELEVISKKGYSPYFLIVSDFVNHARETEIITNTRGSAAGSFVSFLVGISNVSPIRYGLPFERFLNPYRPSPPDIDMDFADDRRDEIIEYAKQRYGYDKVAQIGTFGTMMARAAARDITRALNHDYATGDRIAKMIPMGSQGFPMSIRKAMTINTELKKAYESEKETKEILDLAQKIEGGARHVSVHAAGVVISPEPLQEYLPLQYEPKGEKIITQYDMHAVEDIGLLKMDFLGIRNLSILGLAKKLIEKIRGGKLDLEKIPLDDEKTFELLRRGETGGLFQLGGSGMTRYLKELKPTTIEEIMAMIALFRPGPMANIPTYIKRKHGEEPITYLDPRLEKILGGTYGVVTYQEDVLFIAIEMAGYNWDSVDKFRKAIGKKIPEVMAAQEKIFIEGCQTHGGLSKKKAEELWKLFDPFKGYGFNKAHAASYGIVAYQTAYLKANYPGEYMTAVLTCESGDMDKISEMIAECKKMGIKLLPPDINESFSDFTLVKETDPSAQTEEKNSIRFGLHAIKNVGENVVKTLIEERKRGGIFKSVEDLLERIPTKDINKKSLESLIKAGALDGFRERNTLLLNLEKMLEYHKDAVNGNSPNQASLFAMAGNELKASVLKMSPAEPASLEEKLVWEKEFLGIYVSGHPMDKYRNAMNRAKLRIASVKKFRGETPVMMIVMVSEIKKIMTKKGEPMAFLKLMDSTGEIEAVVFPRTLNNFGSLLKTDGCVIIKGKTSSRNNEPSIILEEIREVKI
ncbi:MAG: DNA polymerase III subunit alpha [Candidatus Pacebacteria bacterium]|nr:DNA polymerase III subunit alpha [Candidatus Paceibacterota bacterium]